MKTIGERIRIRREQLQLSQEELAKKLGYKSRSSINKIENDARNLTQSKIKAIADALQTTPSYIMGWEKEESQAEVLADIFTELNADKELQAVMQALIKIKKNDPANFRNISALVQGMDK